MEGFYNGTQGSVDRPTSKSRKTTNLELVLELIRKSGRVGVTYKDVDSWLGTNHGASSGALSNLHKLALVFVTNETRQHCQVYYHHELREMFPDAERHDEPVRTGSKQKQMISAVLDAAERVVASGGTPLDVALLENILNQYKEQIK